MTIRILFLCKGNICRSPLAEGIYRDMMRAAGISCETDSAGTENWNEGLAPDMRAIAATRMRGYDIAGLRARVLRSQDFHEFDVIYAMDRQNLRDALRIRPDDGRADLRLLTSIAGQEYDIPDPYYTGQFMPVIETLEAVLPSLISHLDGSAQ